MKHLLIIFGAFAMFTAPALAYCSTPMEPFCVNNYGGFDSQYEFDSCVRELEYYADQLNDYVGCVSQEASTEATEAYNAAVESFNDRASGR